MKQLKKYIAAAVVLMLTACSEQPPAEVKTPLVETYRIPVKNIENIKNLPAIVKASDFTLLSFRVKGELIDIAVRSGQVVKKGQLLAKLDPTNYQITVNDRKSKTELAKKSRDRAAKMVTFGNMAQSTLDELNARYRVAQADYEYAKLELSYVELRAPFDGIISSIPADNFQATMAGETVITMHSKDMVEIQVSLPDLILSAANNRKDKSKLVFDVLLDAYPEHVFKAHYKEHTTEQTDENKKYVLILEMPIDKERITLQGMPGNIKVDLARLKMKKIPTVSVPVEAVLLPDNENSEGLERIVWRVLPNNTVEPVTVKAQSLANLTALNVSGALKEGDVIITQGMTYLTKGMEVKIKNQGAVAE